MEKIDCWSLLELGSVSINDRWNGITDYASGDLDLNFTSQSVLTIVNCQPSLVGLDDLTAQQQANPRAILFGRIKRNEQVGSIKQPNAAIPNPEIQVVIDYGPGDGHQRR